MDAQLGPLRSGFDRLHLLALTPTKTFISAHKVGSWADADCVPGPILDTTWSGHWHKTKNLLFSCNGQTASASNARFHSHASHKRVCRRRVCLHLCTDFRRITKLKPKWMGCNRVFGKYGQMRPRWPVLRMEMEIPLHHDLRLTVWVLWVREKGTSYDRIGIFYGNKRFFEKSTGSQPVENEVHQV